MMVKQTQDSGLSGSLEYESRLRLQQAREVSRKHPSELAQYVGNSPSSYYDLANCDGELFMNIDLRDLAGICKTLGIGPKSLFGITSSERVVTPAELCKMIEVHLRNSDVALSDFEKKVNYAISPALNDEFQVLSWNIDCLRNVCSEIGVNWIDALPS